MSTCKGTIVHDEAGWYCLTCGCTSTSWYTAHQPLQSPAMHFLTCLLELAAEVDAQESVEATEQVAA